MPGYLPRVYLAIRGGYASSCACGVGEPRLSEQRLVAARKGSRQVAAAIEQRIATEVWKTTRGGIA